MKFQPKIGDVLLNKYELISLVGEGAFGSVFRARDIKLDRIVAVKFIQTTGGMLERFSDELDAIKNLDHPNIVRLYDYDILKGGVPCIVMEFVNGREVGEVLVDEGPFKMERICTVAQQVLDALVETHKHNIIHCDLKPENIMLTNVGARSDVVKLIDFGVASMLSNTSEDNERQKLLIGTPQYMAPEQITHGQLGPWTDIYALGLILIELYTGQFVFDDEDPRAVLKMQLHNPVVIPHKLACSPLGPIISRATEKEIAKRYQSTQEFYDDVCEAAQAIRSGTRIQSKSIRQHLNSERATATSVFDDLADLGDFKPAAPISSGDNSIIDSKDNPVVTVTKKKSHRATMSQVDISDLQSSLNLSLSSLEDAAQEIPSTTSPVHSHSSAPTSPQVTNLASISSDRNLSVSRSGSSSLTTPLVKEATLAARASTNPNISCPKPVIQLDAPQKSHTAGIVIFVIFALLVGGGLYAYSSGLLNQFLPSEEEVPSVVVQHPSEDKVEPEAEKIDENSEKEADAAPVARKKNVLFSTLRSVAKQMAFEAAISGAYGRSTSIRKYQVYRVIGTPRDAGIYIGEHRVCGYTPCSIYYSGEVKDVTVEIRSGDKFSSVNLAKQNPKDPIILAIGK